MGTWDVGIQGTTPPRVGSTQIMVEASQLRTVASTSSPSGDTQARTGKEKQARRRINGNTPESQHNPRESEDQKPLLRRSAVRGFRRACVKLGRMPARRGFRDHGAN